MKNISFALLAALVGLLAGCSASQDASASGTKPTPTVDVSPPKTEPVVEKPKEDKPPTQTETPPEDPPSGGGRMALQQCEEASRKVNNCATIAKPVCAEVDTGIRCIRAPCPSTAQQTFANACVACQDKKVRGYWPMSCEDMTRPAAP